MAAKLIASRVWTVALLLSVWPGVPTLAQSSSANLGSVRIPKAVMADGQALPAGTYVVRLSGQPVTPVIGQSPDSARWVEFVQSGQVKGRELATVVAGEDVRVVAKGGTPPAGGAKVQLLKGADYVRVWFNQGGTNYLVHLGVSAR